MRNLVVAMGLMMLVAGLGADAQAQTPAPGKCYANFIEVCIKNCTKVGGRVAGCPAYCAKEKRDRNCP